MTKQLYERGLQKRICGGIYITNLQNGLFLIVSENSSQKLQDNVMSNFLKNNFDTPESAIKFTTTIDDFIDPNGSKNNILSIED